MRRWKGGKMTVAGLWLVVAAAVFLFQAGTASPGTPGVCEAPCGEEPGAAQLPVQAQAVELGGPESAGTEVESAGALGYRVPLVVKQQVPARILGGVYMPAHETYVVLRPGYWELEGAAEDAAPAAASEPTQAPEAAKGCWLRRLFRKLGRCDGGS